MGASRFGWLRPSYQSPRPGTPGDGTASGCRRALGVLKADAETFPMFDSFPIRWSRKGTGGASVPSCGSVSGPGARAVVHSAAKVAG
jgi:hypothetical protein